MKFVSSLVCALACAAAAHAQSPRRIVGNTISGNLAIDARSRTVTDTATLTFQSSDGRPSYTIDFVTRHAPLQPVVAPGVVDIVVTQLPVEDETPEMTLRLDGESVPLVARLHTRRSVMATVPLAELDRIASAGVVVDRTFGAELELGSGQIRMLRATVDRWTGRAR